MTDRYETLASRLDERFGEQVALVPSTYGEVTIEVKGDDKPALVAETLTLAITNT